MSALSSLRSAWTCQSKRTWVPVAVGRQRPRPAAGQVAVDLRGHRARRLERDDARARVQVVGQAPLEVLARLLAQLGRPVGIDVEVDRAPPFGVGPRVGDRGEDRLARRRDIPLVDEDVGAHQPGGAQHEARQRLLDAQRRARGVALVAEIGHEHGARDRLGEAEAVEVARRAHGRHALEEGLRAARGADLDADVAVGRLVARDLAVRDAGGDLHGLARAEQVLAALLDDLQGAGHDLVALDLPGVDMGLHEEAAGSPEDVELDQLPVRLVCGPDERTRQPNSSISSKSPAFAISLAPPGSR